MGLMRVLWGWCRCCGADARAPGADVGAVGLMRGAGGTGTGAGIMEVEVRL